MFSPGDRIKFVYTGQDAEVLSIYPDGMLRVRTLPDREEMPAFDTDVVLSEDFQGILEAPMAKRKKPKALPKGSTADLFFSPEAWREMERRYGEGGDEHAPPPAPEPQKTGAAPLPHPLPNPLGPDSGVHLLFRPELTGEEITLYILNDTNQSFTFSLELLANGTQIHHIKLLLPARECFAVGTLGRAQLNAKPEARFEVAAMHLSRQVRIKPQNVFQLYTGLPGAPFTAGLLTLTSKLTAAASTQSLAAYTQKQLKRMGGLREAPAPVSNRTERLAHFPLEIDLHLEKLVKEPGKLSPAEALRVQMDTFDAYLKEAIELEAPSFFVIHGLGNGRLRQEVENLLRRNDWVNDFRNHYHPKYGFGATEVFL